MNDEMRGPPGSRFRVGEDGAEVFVPPRETFLVTIIDVTRLHDPERRVCALVGESESVLFSPEVSAWLARQLGPPEARTAPGSDDESPRQARAMFGRLIAEVLASRSGP